MKKRVIIGLAALAVVAVVLALWLGLRDKEGIRQAATSKGQPVPGAEKSPPKPTPTPVPAARPGQTTAPQENILPPRNSEEVKEIGKLDFGECQQSLSDECQKQLALAKYRLEQVRDPSLVSELIVIAEWEKVPFPSWYNSAHPMVKMMYRQGLCSIRHAAIHALGEIKDPKAVEVLLSIMEEGYSEDTGDYITLNEEGHNVTCEVAGGALVSMNPSNVSDRLFNDLKQIWPVYEEAERKARAPESSRLLNPDENSDLSATYAFAYELSGPYCYLSALGSLNDLKIKNEIIFELSKDLSDSQAAMYLTSAQYFPLSEEDIAIIKPYLSINQNQMIEGNGNEKILQGKAMKSITQNPYPKYVDLYVWLIDQGYVEEGLEALSKTKSPEAIRYFSEALTGKYSRQVVTALFNFDAKDIQPFTPVLLEEAKKHPSSDYYWNALVKSQDASVVRDLYSIISTITFSPEDGPPIIDGEKNLRSADVAKNCLLRTIGLIIDPESQDVLRKIIADDGKYNLPFRRSALYWLIYQTGEEAIEYGKRYIDLDEEWLKLKGRYALIYHNKYNPKEMIESKAY